jgi:hypothetical protein
MSMPFLSLKSFRMLNESLHTQKAAIRAYIAQHLHHQHVDALMQDECFNTYAEFYDYYPYLFKDAFSDVDEQQVQQVNIAGFLCYKAVVLKDEYIDKKAPDENDLRKLEASQLFYGASKKILAQVFAEASTFWQCWALRKTELEAANALDRKLNENNFSYRTYQTFADNKSAMAKLAIDSLYVMGGQQQPTVYNDLLRSHREFSTAMQLFDDLFDIEEDIENDQFNIAILYLQQFLRSQQIEYKQLSVDTIEKHLFLSDVAADILAKALHHIQKARQWAKPYGLANWMRVLDFYEGIYRGVVSRKASYIATLQAKVYNSQVLIAQASTLQATPQNLQASIAMATAFVEGKQAKSGHWFEYLTSAGASDIWATGFIGYLGHGLLSNDVTEKALAALRQDAHPLWGYRVQYLADTDSSNFALLLYGVLGKNIHPPLKALLARQNSDGGFPTYTAADVERLRELMRYPPEKNYNGWTQSYACVSAVTLCLLGNSSGKAAADAQVRLEAYLLQALQQQKPAAYWWTSDIYTLYWLALAYNSIESVPLKAMVVERINKQQRLLAGEQALQDGHGQLSIFYSAMLLKAVGVLRDAGAAVADIATMQRLAQWILQHQYDDGSWHATDAMRLPDTDVLNPVTVKAWPVSEMGCNVRAIEFNRLFTTIIAIGALTQYGKSFNK